MVVYISIDLYGSIFYIVIVYRKSIWIKVLSYTYLRIQSKWREASHAALLASYIIYIIYYTTHDNIQYTRVCHHQVPYNVCKYIVNTNTNTNNTQQYLYLNSTQRRTTVSIPQHNNNKYTIQIGNNTTICCTTYYTQHTTTHYCTLHKTKHKSQITQHTKHNTNNTT